MIEHEKRTSDKSGVTTDIYRSHSCELSLHTVDGIFCPSYIKHTTEHIYAPEALVNCSQKDGWVMLFAMPKFYIASEDWPRLKAATEDIVQFWNEVRGELQPPSSKEG